MGGGGFGFSFSVGGAVHVDGGPVRRSLTGGASRFVPPMPLADRWGLPVCPTHAPLADWWGQLVCPHGSKVRNKPSTRTPRRNRTLASESLKSTIPTSSTLKSVAEQGLHTWHRGVRGHTSVPKQGLHTWHRRGHGSRGFPNKNCICGAREARAYVGFQTSIA